MKTKLTLLSILILTVLFSTANLAEAQYRSDIPSGFDYTGPVTKPLMSNNPGFLGLMDFRMDHSYEMTMGSFGGDMYNQNFYTNTMHFLFNENLYGRVDLGIAHSPFGNNMMGDDNVQFFVRNAEINYRFNERSQIRLSFNQVPMNHGYGYGGYYNPFMSPHHRSNFGVRPNSNFHGW